MHNRHRTIARRRRIRPRRVRLRTTDLLPLVSNIGHLTFRKSGYGVDYYGPASISDDRGTPTYFRVNQFTSVISGERRRPSGPRTRRSHRRPRTLAMRFCKARAANAVPFPLKLRGHGVIVLIGNAGRCDAAAYEPSGVFHIRASVRPNVASMRAGPLACRLAGAPDYSKDRGRTRLSCKTSRARPRRTHKFVHVRGADCHIRDIQRDLTK